MACGKNSTTMLYAKATPTPSGISVNILAWPEIAPFQPRTKKGIAAHNTTGALSANSIHARMTGDIIESSALISPSMASAKTGMESANEIQKRRNMSRYSDSSCAAVGPSGSSAIPQTGQWPGPICESADAWDRCRQRPSPAKPAVSLCRPAGDGDERRGSRHYRGNRTRIRIPLGGMYGKVHLIRIHTYSAATLDSLSG